MSNPIWPLHFVVAVVVLALAPSAASAQAIASEATPSQPTSGEGASSESPTALADAVLAVQIPQLYKLVGLKQGDHLNVRSEATASSADLGDINVSDGPVEIIDIDETGGWGKIVWQDANAWLSLRYLEADNSGYLDTVRVPAGLQCVGTEPFWTYQITSNSSASLLLPDRNNPPEMILDQALGSSNRVNYPVALLAASESVSTTSMLRAALCFDGMSDREYGWTADILVYQRDKQLLFSGCCHVPIPGDG